MVGAVLIGAADAVVDRLDSLARWSRLRSHLAEERRVRRRLETAAGLDFDRLRERWMELRLCLNPESCRHLARRR